jgi:hypothetical protein
MSIVERLFARGLRRDQVVLSFDESVGNSAASAGAPTTVISTVSHLGNREGPDATKKAHRVSGRRLPIHVPNPKVLRVQQRRLG